MKIVFFIGSMRRGGAERVISILADHYCKVGWNVEIALLLDNGVGYELDPRIKIVDLSRRESSYIRNIAGWLVSIRRYIRKGEPDRVVSFIGRINMLVLTACIGMNVPIIVSERNDPKHDGRSGLMLWLCNMSYMRASAVIFQTKYEQSCFSALLKTRSYVIPNPIEINFMASPPVGHRIVTAGRLLPQKNHKMLIEAASQLIGEFPTLKFDIYGSGMLMDTLEEQITELGLSEIVTLCGNVMDLHKRISTANIFVMTSEFEGLSNALMEAMTLGLPCITTNYPGADEVVQDGVNGLVVPCGDAKALADAIKRILVNASLQMKLRTGALATSAHYKSAVVLRQWERVINCED